MFKMNTELLDGDFEPDVGKDHARSTFILWCIKEHAQDWFGERLQHDLALI